MVEWRTSACCCCARIVRASSRRAALNRLSHRHSSRERFAKDEQKEEHWIEIELLYEDGTCVAGAKYLIVTPDKQEKAGVTNAYGRARVDGIPVAGQCKISFPEIEGEAWKKA